jgi:hypothetical protein
MGYREAKELARIRCELREHLLGGRDDGVSGLLARLRALADDSPDADLAGEYQRWRIRFQLMAPGHAGIN